MIWYSDLEKIGINEQHQYYDLITSAHLITALQQKFTNITVQVLQQKIRKIGLQLFWIRKVNICNDQHPIIHAKTIIDHNLYITYQVILDSLGDNPIGANFLYKQPYKREPFMYCLRGNDLCRKSRFLINTKPILLIEQFIGIVHA